MTVLRRARPALGTLVELGIRTSEGPRRATRPGWGEAALSAGWAALAEVEGAMSAFLPESDVFRFNAAPAGARLEVRSGTAAVLRLSRALWRESGGLLDVSLGTGPAAWSLDSAGGTPVLCKHAAEVRLDLGGIAKGYAVDRALEALAAAAAEAAQPPACWVNAGGDLRTRGVAVRVHLRDERAGGARPWIELREGALATSDFGARARARLAGEAPRARHVSVVSPRCCLSDALTKVVALSGRADHPLVLAHRARAFIHDPLR
ncbi:MAG TPA: FAD:protein FMN transferase [Anaeromyxobacter sp.]|nr:FAD:protein FMN transferase [Anaeromyxobacter sp.]